MYKFSDTDIKQIAQKGIKLETVNSQLQSFEKGFPFANIHQAATIDNGIIKLSENELKEYISTYKIFSKNKEIIKFVPASGAASRMFKFLFEFLDALNSNSANELLQKPEFKQAKLFFNNLNKFPFYKDLSLLIKTENEAEIIKNLLLPQGLNYSNLPKALIKFHKYEDNSRFAIEEHLMEAAQYACNTTNNAHIHFTVSENHKQLFANNLKEFIPKYEQKNNVVYNIDLSVQRTSTDTIAVDMNNKPVRDNDDKMIFRPAGHGALIENLNDINADLIFIKNIDNIIGDDKRQSTIDYKKALAGIALERQQETFSFINQLSEHKNLEKAITFAKESLNIILNNDFDRLNIEEKYKQMISLFNRPLRVCGMVKNEGEPGGGPFWVNKNGNISLQIVEGAEIDKTNTKQKQISENATHFNPVDLICLTKDHKGNKFNLKKYVDNNAGFISEKSHNGSTLKAMELPGLWNGAMAFWNTIFVEVPISTFNPVKTVNDLLRR